MQGLNQSRTRATCFSNCAAAKQGNVSTQWSSVNRGLGEKVIKEEKLAKNGRAILKRDEPRREIAKQRNILNPFANVQVPMSTSVSPLTKRPEKFEAAPALTQLPSSSSMLASTGAICIGGKSKTESDGSLMRDSDMSLAFVFEPMRLGKHG
jgi:hypothetical protein